MGLDLTYQALPPGSGFPELVSSRSWKSATWIAFAPGMLKWGVQAIRPTFSAPTPDIDDPDFVAVWDWCCEAAGRFPDLSERSFDLGKGYRWAPFILSAKERARLRWPRPTPLDPRSWNDPGTDVDDLMMHAFGSAEEILPGTGPSVGGKLWLISQPVTEEIGVYIGAMLQEEIEQRVAELIEMPTIPATDEELVLRLFSGFQSFFVTAAERGESILATLI